MSITRTTCTDCGLPYYEDQSRCPYCDRAGGSADSAGATAGDAADPAETSPSDAGEPAAGARPRKTCPTCGLPHYGDEGDDCPYCERAEGATTAGSATTSESASESAGEATSDRSVSNEATDATADAGSDGAPVVEDRSRKTCPECGLPYYADGGDCPYCERAGASGGGPSVETADDTTGAGAETSTPEADPATTDRSAAEATDERGDRGGIIARVKRLFMG